MAKPVADANVAVMDADWLDHGGAINRKPSQHQNLEENRASYTESIPVVNSAASRCLPTHWDPAAAACLSTCLVSFLVNSFDWFSLILPLWSWISRRSSTPTIQPVR